MSDGKTTSSLVDDMAEEYRLDAEARLEKIAAAVSRLDGGATMDDDALAEIKQLAHSIKGTSSTFGFSGLSVVAHVLDDFVNTGIRDDVTAFVHDLSQLNDLMVSVLAAEIVVAEDAVMDMLAGVTLKTGHEMRHDSSPRPGQEPCAIIILPNRDERTDVSHALNALGLVVIEAWDGVQAIDHAAFCDPAVIITTLHDKRFNALDVIQGLAEVSITASIPVVVIVPELENLPDANEREAMKQLMSTLPPHIHQITAGKGLERALSGKLAELKRGNAPET